MDLKKYPALAALQVLAADWTVVDHDTNPHWKKQHELFLKKHPWANPLADKLTRVAGKYLSWNEGFIPLLKRLASSQGRWFRTKQKLHEGVQGLCYSNAVKIWKSDPKRYALYFGFAFGNGGAGTAYPKWDQHAWIFDRERNVVIETTFRRNLYYGIELTPQECRWLSGKVERV